MQAMQVNDPGQKPVLVRADMPKPKPGAAQVLIHVRAAGVTPTELLWSTTTHTESGSVRTRAVPSHEFSGVVAAVGENVRRFNIGDEIYGMNDWFADGAAAEYCLTLPQNISAKPKVLTHEEAVTAESFKAPLTSSRTPADYRAG